MNKIILIFLSAVFTLGFINSSFSKQEKLFKLPRNMPAPELLEEEIHLPIPEIPNYRDEIRNIITTFSKYAKDAKPNFLIIPREGLNVLQRGEWEKNYDDIQTAYKKGVFDKDEAFLNKLFENTEYPDAPIGTTSRQYMNSIDGVVINNLFCGNEPPHEEIFNLLKEENKNVITFENCINKNTATKAKEIGAQIQIPVFANIGKKDNFSQIPSQRPYLENTKNINSIKDVRNILVLTDNYKYGDKDTWLFKLQENNYDMLVIEPFFKNKNPLTYKEVNELKFKKIGSKRLVLGYMNITEAFDNKHYWENNWRIKKPYWLRFKSRQYKHGVITEYWNPKWKEIIGRYFDGIFKLGFDGIIIDGLDNHMLFERLTPIQ